jgi:SAM-dependent methyltransferase
MQNTSETADPKHDIQPRSHTLSLLFLASFVTLFFELVVIRYLSSEIRVFAYLKNMPLIASFLGIGMGMILGSRTQPLRAKFPTLAAFFFTLIWLCTRRGLNRFGLPTETFGIWNNDTARIDTIGTIAYFAFFGSFLYLVVRLFLPLGGMVGDFMAQERSPLRAYAVNLVGSLTGISGFTVLSFVSAPPWVWLLVGFICILPFIPRTYINISLLAATVTLTAFPHGNNYWSPYYHIELFPGAIPAGASQPASYELRVNYDYHQTMLDLSEDFRQHHPEIEPNRSAFMTWDLPFRLAPEAKDVLVVGAGTGNDVAAALRNGAIHVDAVEIDPTILSLGKHFHPEHPYDSPRVTVYVNDARAYFKQTQHKYDLIIFGYLDSHTMFSSLSSLRLDNYVYTKESFEEARRLLKPGGTLVVGFASGRTLVTPRLASTLRAAFGTAPAIFETGYLTSGIVFVEGGSREARTTTGLLEISDWVQHYNFGIATDSWPFLYLPRRGIPWPIWSVLIIFALAAIVLVLRLLPREYAGSGRNVHFFLLGAGFLLLETSGITQLSLLFGSTWVVNAVVIGAFLCMALLSNLLVMHYAVPLSVAYGGVLISTLLTTMFPFASLNVYPIGHRMVVAGLLTALPVFFSGMVFSQSLSQCPNAAQALGVNLIGSVVGGALETTVMVGGTGVLGPLAILLYLGSLVPIVITWVRAPRAATA